MSKKYFVIAALVCVMVLTTALSLAYWADGIDGDTSDYEHNINIGTGNTATTIVSLNGPGTSAGELVPHNVPAKDGEVTEINFTVNTTWGPGVDPKDLVTATTEGDLTVELVGFYLNDGPDTAVNQLEILRGDNDEDLFFIEVDPYTMLANNTPVPIAVKLLMNQPTDKTTYDKIKEQSVRIVLEFNIEPRQSF